MPLTYYYIPPASVVDMQLTYVIRLLPRSYARFYVRTMKSSRISVDHLTVLAPCNLFRLRDTAAYVKLIPRRMHLLYSFFWTVCLDTLLHNNHIKLKPNTAEMAQCRREGFDINFQLPLDPETQAIVDKVNAESACTFLTSNESTWWLTFLIQYYVGSKRHSLLYRL